MERKHWFGLIESFLVMDASEIGEELDRYVLKGFGDFKKKRIFIKSFAQWLSFFHRMDLYHKDMKSCNIMASKNGETWDFRLLDLEDVLLNEKVDEKKLFRNFLQLNTSTPKVITRTDRFRFFGEYIDLNPIIKKRSVFLKRLLKESRRRGLVYVSPQGVVDEKL